jgi:hypothetical protein
MDLRGLAAEVFVMGRCPWVAAGALVTAACGLGTAGFYSRLSSGWDAVGDMHWQGQLPRPTSWWTLGRHLPLPESADLAFVLWQIFDTVLYTSGEYSGCSGVISGHTLQCEELGTRPYRFGASV